MNAVSKFQKHGVVLVGIDGSAGARRAARAALVEAQARGARLHLLYAASPLYGLTGLDPEQDERDIAEYQEKLNESVKIINDLAPDIEVSSSVVIEDPAYALVKGSYQADLLVLGARSLNAMQGVILGSVTNKVLPYAACPTLVVHDREFVEGGNVVAGIAPESGSPNTMRFAFEEAQRRGRPLTLLSARQHTLSATQWFRNVTRQERINQYVAKTAEKTRQAIDAIAAEFTDVTYTFEVVDEHAAEALAELSDEASVTIVGSQGKHGNHGILGSVSIAVLREAPKVIVVPEGEDA